MAITPPDAVALGSTATSVVLWRASGLLRATIVLKATFRMVPDRDATLTATQPIETEDRAYEDSPSGGLRAANELAPYLPSAGVLLTGRARAPAGAPQNAVSVRLAIFEKASLLDKTVHVFGDVPANGGTAAPFQSMPLVYERAYGGPGVLANPIGVGGAGQRRPNLVDPANPHRPACFGPMAVHWPLRRRLFSGTEPRAADGQILDLPGDFDFRAFHAAPPDQQIDFLQGGEWILLDNLCAGRPRMQTRLPSARGLARWSLTTGAGPSRPREIRMFADTLVIDADRQLLSLVWRGHFPIELPDVLPQMRVWAGIELPGAPVEWPEQRAASAGAGGSGAATSGPPSGLLRTAPEQGAARKQPALPFEAAKVNPVVFQVAKSGDDDDDPEERFAMTGAVIRAKLDKPALPFPNKDGAQQSQLLADLPRVGDDEEDTEDPLATTRRLDMSKLSKPVLPFRKDELEAAPKARRIEDDETTSLFVKPPGIDQEETAIGIDPAALGFRPQGLPESFTAPVAPPAPPAPQAMAPPAAAPPPSPFAPPAAPTSPFAPPAAPPISPFAPPAAMATAPPVMAPPAPPAAPQAMAPPAPSAPPMMSAPASPAGPGPSGASTAPAAGPDPQLRKRAQDAIAAGSELDGLDLSGADLEGLDFSGRSLQRCVLRGANLRGARFKGSKLAGADLSEADLTGADLTGAALPNARAERATLTDAVLVDADLTGASFAGATAERAKLTRARGEGVVFRDANLRKADLSQARFQKGVFSRADLREAQAEQGNFFGARFSRADLGQTSFRKASLVGAVLAFARLDGTDLRSADLDKANFHNAPRRKAKLVGAVLTNLDETEPKDLEPAE